MAAKKKAKDLIRQVQEQQRNTARVDAQGASAFDMEQYVQNARKALAGMQQGLKTARPAAGMQNATPAAARAYTPETGNAAFDMDHYLNAVRKITGSAGQSMQITGNTLSRMALNQMTQAQQDKTYDQMIAQFYANMPPEARARLTAFQSGTPLTQEQISEMVDIENRRYSDDVSAWDWMFGSDAEQALRQANINYETDLEAAMHYGAMDTPENLILNPQWLSDEALANAMAEENLPALWAAEQQKVADSREAWARVQDYTRNLQIQDSLRYQNVYNAIATLSQMAQDVPEGDAAGLMETIDGYARDESIKAEILAELVAFDNVLNGTGNSIDNLNAMDSQTQAAEVRRMLDQYYDYKEKTSRGAYEYNPYPYDVVMERVRTEIESRNVRMPYMEIMMADPDVYELCAYMPKEGTGNTTEDVLYKEINEDPDYMLTPLEIAVFNYYYNKGDTEGARAYMYQLEPIERRRERDIDRANWELLATDNVFTGALTWVGARGANVLNAATSPIDQVAALMGVKSVNSNVFYDYANTVTQSQTQAIGEFDESLWRSIKGISDEEAEAGKTYAPQIFGQTPLQIGYSSASSGADMGLAIGLSTLTGGAISPLTIMAMEAAANEYGSTHGEEMAPLERTVRSVVEGGKEYLTEMLPLDVITTGGGKKWHRALSGLSEGAEEFVSEGGGILADKAISRMFGHDDELETQEKDLRLRGDTNPEKTVARDVRNRLGSATLVGTVSGYGMGAGGDVINYSQNRSIGKTVRNAGNAEALVQLGAAMETGTQSNEAAQELTKAMKDGKKPSAAGLGKLYRSLMADTQTQYHEDIRQATAAAVEEQIIEKNQETGDALGNEFTTKEIAEAIVKANGNPRAIKGRIGTFIRTHRSTSAVMEEFREGNAQWSQSLTNRRMMRRAQFTGQIGAIEATTKKTGNESTPDAEDVTKQTSGRVEALTGRRGGKEVSSMAVTLTAGNGSQAPATIKRATKMNKGIGLVVEQDGVEKEVTLDEVAKISGTGVANVIAYAESHQEISAEEMNTMIRLTEETKIDSSRIISAYEAGVNAGFQKAGKPELQRLVQGLSKADAQALNSAIQMGYDAGMAEADAAEAERVQAAQRRAAAVQEGAARVIYLGEHETLAGVTSSGVRMGMKRIRGELTEQQNAAVDALTQVSQAVGVNVAFYRSKAEKGRQVELPNGFYDDAKRTIYIDLNAGVNEGGQEMVERTIMQTAAHELTHYIERGSAEGYRQLRQMMKDRLQTQGRDYMQMVLEKVRESQIPLTRAQAEAEVIADASELMLRDSQAIQEMAQKNKSLAARIAQFVTDFARRIRRAIGSYMPTTKESAALTEMRSGVLKYVDGLQEAWDKALIEAAGRTETRETVRVTKRTAEEYRAVTLEGVKAETKEKAVEAMTRAGDAQITQEVAQSVTEEVVEAAVDAAIEAGTNLTARMDGETMLETMKNAAQIAEEQNGEQAGKLAQAVVYMAADDVISKGDIQQAVENAAEALAASVDMTQEQLRSVQTAAVQAMEEAAEKAGIAEAETQEAEQRPDSGEIQEAEAQQNESPLLAESIRAAEKTAQEVYDGPSGEVKAALTELAETAAREAVERLEFEKTVEAAESRVDVREALREMQEETETAAQEETEELTLEAVEEAPEVALKTQKEVAEEAEVEAVETQRAEKEKRPQRPNLFKQFVEMMKTRVDEAKIAKAEKEKAKAEAKAEEERKRQEELREEVRKRSEAAEKRAEEEMRKKREAYEERKRKQAEKWKRDAEEYARELKEEYKAREEEYERREKKKAAEQRAARVLEAVQESFNGMKLGEIFMEQVNASMSDVLGEETATEFRDALYESAEQNDVNLITAFKALAVAAFDPSGDSASREAMAQIAQDASGGIAEDAMNRFIESAREDFKRADLREMLNDRVKELRKEAEAQGDTGYQFSQRKKGGYDYSKPFAQQVEDLRNGDFPKYDALVIGRTPEILRKIGLSDLPLTINQSHVLGAINESRDTAHNWSKRFVQELPTMLENPIAVYESTAEGKQEKSVVVLLKAIINGKPYIAPVYVTGKSTANDAEIDSNNMATVFRKGNAVTKQLMDAIQKEQTEQVGLYYWQKEEARILFDASGVQFPGLTMKDGLIHSISETGSPVNRESVEQTETRQFKRWFRGSVVVNADGTPKVVYHGTNGDFNTFQSDNGTYWFSESDDYAEAMAHERGGKRIVKAYLSLKNPYRTSLPANQFSNDNFEAPIIRKAKARGYDGVIIENETDSEYAQETFYVVFEPTQIKSATENIGLFDPENPDIRYSRRRATAPSFRQAMLDMPITGDMTPLEKELLEKYKGYVQEYNDKQEQINAQVEIINAEAEKKENADKDAVTKANNRMAVLKVQQRRVENKLYQAEKRGGYANLMARYRTSMQAYMAGDSVEEAGRNIARQIASVERRLEDLKRGGMDISPRELEEKLAKLVDKRALEQTVEGIRAEWGDTLSKAEIRRRVITYHALMASGEKDSAKVQQHLEKIVRDMNRTTDEAGTHRLEALRDNISGQLILDRETAEEIKSAVGSVAEYRNVVRKVFKSVRMAKEGEKGNADLILENAPDWVKQELFGSTENEKDFALGVYNIIKEARAQDVFESREGAELLKAETAKLLATIENGAGAKSRGTRKLLEAWQKGTITGKDIADAELTNAIDDLWLARKEAYGLSRETTAKELVTYYARLNEQNRLEQERENLRKVNESLKETVADWFKERELMEQRRKLHDAIKRQVNWMDARIRKETDQRRIPEGLKPMVEEAVRAFARANDVMTMFPKKDADFMLAVYDRLKAAQGGAVQVDDLLQEDLQDALEALNEKIDAYGKTVREKGVRLSREERLSAIKARVDILQDISDVVAEIRGAVDQADSIFMGEKQLQLAQKAGQFETELKGKTNYAVRDNKIGEIGQGLKKFLHDGNLTAPYFFRELDSEVMTELNQDLLDAQNKHAFLFKDAKETIAQIQEETHYWGWKNTKPLEITTWQGSNPGANPQEHTIQLTADEALSLWATWKREHSDSSPLVRSSHLEKGGFNLAKGTRKENGKNVQDKLPHRLNARDMAKIEAWLTDDMKAYAERMMDYMSNEVAELGNETSMKLFNIRKFTEKNYFPMKVQRAQLDQKSNAGRRSEEGSNRIAHFAGSKRRVDQATKPLEIGGFTSVAADHIEQMLRYATFAIPIENFNKILNQPVYMGDILMEADGTEVDATSRMTLRGLFEQKYGKDALTYLNNYLTDVNGGPMLDNRSKGIWNKMMSRYKKSAVVASLSVAVQQPCSVIRAMCVLDPKYFAKQSKNTGNVRKEWEQLTQYSGVALIKARGGFDMTGSRGLASQLAGSAAETYGAFKTLKDATRAVREKAEGERAAKIREAQNAIGESLDEIMGKLPGLADQVTWTYIWRAVKSETADLNPGLDVSSDEFLQAAARRFEEVINLTQVYDSTLVRSSSMRSKNEFMQMVTAFMAEPTLTANMLMDAARRSTWRNPKPLAKAALVYVVSQTVTAMAKALVTAGRDDDKEKPWLEKYLNAVHASLGGWGSDLNPLNLFPWVRDAISIIEGYDVSRSDMAAYETLYKELMKVMNGKYADDPWKGIENAGGAVATMFGIPMKNIMRDLRTGYNTVISFADGRRAPNAMAIKEDASKNLLILQDRNNGWYGKKMYQAMLAGDEEELSDLKEYMAVQGKDESQVNGMIREAVKGRVLNGDVTEADAKKLLLENGLAEDSKEAFRYVDRWVEDAANKGVEGYTYSQYNGMYAAISATDAAAVSAAVKELKSNGFLTEKGSMKTTLRNKYRDQYRELSKTDRGAFANLQAMIVTALAAVGYRRDEALEYVKGWLQD